MLSSMCATCYAARRYTTTTVACSSNARTEIPSMVQSHAWESGFTVEGRVSNKRRRRMLWQDRLNDLSDSEFLKRYKVRKVTFDKMVRKLRPLASRCVMYQSTPQSPSISIASTFRRR